MSDNDKATNYIEDKEARKAKIAESTGKELLDWLLAFYKRDSDVRWGSPEMQMMMEIRKALESRLNESSSFSAGRAAGLEEAAKVLESGTHTPDEDGVTYSTCHSDTCLYLCEERRRLAKSIRQLLQPKPTEEEGRG